MKFKLGERVQADDRLIRVTRACAPRSIREWVYVGSRKQFPDNEPFPAMPIEGIVVGQRTLCDGELAGYYGEQSTLVNLKHRVAILIADKLREKPKMAWLDDVRRVGK